MYIEAFLYTRNILSKATETQRVCWQFLFVQLRAASFTTRHTLQWRQGCKPLRPIFGFIYLYIVIWIHSQLDTHINEDKVINQTIEIYLWFHLLIYPWIPHNLASFTTRHTHQWRQGCKLIPGYNLYCELQKAKKAPSDKVANHWDCCLFTGKSCWEHDCSLLNS